MHIIFDTTTARNKFFEEMCVDVEYPQHAERHEKYSMEKEPTTTNGKTKDEFI